MSNKKYIKIKFEANGEPPVIFYLNEEAEYTIQVEEYNTTGPISTSVIVRWVKDLISNMNTKLSGK